MMHRLLFFYLFLMVALLDQAQAKANRPNVLFIAVDDMKDWVNCLGGYEGRVYTPNIDRLANRGMLFTNAHCVSPKCAPSRAAIMMGLRPSTTGFYDNQHWWYPNYPDAETLPILFRNNGYTVSGAGKIFHHTAGNNPPRQWDDYYRLLFRDDPWFRGSRINYPWTKAVSNPPGFPFSKVIGLPHENDWGIIPVADDELDDVRTAGFVVRHLQKSHDKPFFLACGLFRPHLPWYAPKRFFDMYPLNKVVIPDSPEDDLDDVPEAGKRFAASRRSDMLKIEKQDAKQQAVQAYLASISYADEQLGRVLDALESSDYNANTVIVFWSDHGWHLGEKRHWHKSTLWEEATRIPFIIATPKIKPGVCEQPVSLLDIFPTLMELCGVSTDQPLDGLSLVSQLNTPETNRQPALIEFRKGNAAVRSKRWRYIRYEDGSEELYDHNIDPEERVNLSGKRKYQQVKLRLAKWLPREWAKEALSKKAFDFDPETYSWKNRSTKETFLGQKLVK